MTQRQENSEPEAGELQETLLDAALSHVPFDGWSEATFQEALADSGLDAGLASALFPRRSLDLAVAYHRRGDAMMLQKLAEANLGEMRFRDKIATAVRFRLEVVCDKEAVRRGMALFALPHHAAEGTRLIWGTADAIWTALGDTSQDVNWYTKRASLSGVYSSTVLFWLGDDSPGHQATWDFLDRRIENVMQFETLKASVNQNPLLKPLLAGPNWLLNQIQAPKSRDDLPGRWRPRADG
ncbi:COQ9 family protein [Phaeobacter sp. B1627]|uniref:COQ9 family protein n=1 Tax=Phaeobacter sp. B1627 TaxID=2583809 RepID=UPI0011192C95|nr:COQ9 family protein [Phaeobacter sp. B1627]TNJ43007.1 COQ9 family protein [Phaeobacter sp. B1627]